MHLMRVGATGAEIPVAVVDDVAYDLRPVAADVDGAFLAADGIARARAAVSAGGLPTVDVRGLRIGAPVARPSAVICIGQNYAAHAAESGAEPPERPIVFFKHPNTVVGPDDDVPLPPGSTRLDWEVELGVVIGRRASYLGDDDDPLAYVAGYVALDDLSERTWQLDESGGQWSKGKCGPAFAPTGPWLVPADEVDAGALRLRSWVNGEPRQDSSTADMIVDVAGLVRDLSQYMALDPGDVVSTGTPQGVALSGRFPYLAAGDVVEIEIEHLGRQRHVVV